MCVGGGEKKGVKERERCWSVEGVKKRVVMVGGRGRRRGTRERKWGGREWKRKKGEGKDEEKGERESQSPKRTTKTKTKTKTKTITKNKIIRKTSFGRFFLLAVWMYGNRQ